MRLRFKILVSFTLALSILTAGVFWLFYESPSGILRHALHLDKLPPSITKLRMGSDVWTDEIRSFYFEIAPEDFQKLLKGRNFRKIDFPDVMPVKTIHIDPEFQFDSSNRYVWEVEGARCEVSSSSDQHRVIALFSAD